MSNKLANVKVANFANVKQQNLFEISTKLFVTFCILL